ncbi:hypothetical protein ACLB1R_22410 [Escherichia coli]
MKAAPASCNRRHRELIINHIQDILAQYRTSL